ncbi:MAG TPA: VWA domain-containing protein, partial [Terriglobales bacterium]|nr:VWA domain-containing protein [Terriglobales bacterium]
MRSIGALVVLLGGPLVVGGISQEGNSADIQVIVNMVQLNVAVTDNKGDYITNLRPEDFTVVEDGIPQKIATFGEGNERTRRIEGAGAEANAPSTPAGAQTALPDSASTSVLSSLVAGSNVFILFDTSNYMYRGFVFAQDAISDFVRSLENADKIAFYSYSRDLSRSSALTKDRAQILHSVRSTVAGDDAALYNSLLLTVKDAAQYQGRKVIVVFSNGPDNSSVVPPEDVAELAQS